jgi:WD40 repeat protein/serine/threonine protein kinase
MNADEPTPEDEQCASLLAACHEAERLGESRSNLTGAEVPCELRPRLERDLACVRLLDRAWPRRAAAGRADTPSSSDGKSGPSANQVPSTVGRFRVRRELGRGGYGIVFQAYDPQLGRDVALKVPRAEAVLSPELRERFLREARAAAALDHPNLVPVYDAGEVGPVCYIASAYCPGTTLEAWLKVYAEPAPWQEAASLVATLAEAVHHAHASGVVHRDLKPANILLASAGRDPPEEPAFSGGSRPPLAAFAPKITDFGLAKFLSLEPGDGSQFPTQSGAIVGTPRYMAPEQAVGSSQAVGQAVDVHALGAILYEVLTGRPPFVAETVLDTLEQVRSAEPLPPSRLRPKLPRDLETICLKCLQKDPAKRYGRAADLADDLRRFLAGKPIQARPIPAWERVLKWARRRPTAAALVAVSSLASLLLLAGLVVGIVYENERRKEVEQTAYFNAIASAEHEISATNWGQAEELLEQCPERLRDWEWHYLKRLRRTPQLSLPVGERITMSGGGFDLAFHPDGRLVAIPSSANCIQVWDASGGAERPLWTLHGHTDRVLSLAFSPDGRHLASTSEDRTVCLWELPSLGEAGVSAPTGGVLTPSLILRGHNERVNGVAFSPDGQRLASASGDINKAGEVKVWDPVSGRLFFSFPGQAVPNPVVHFAFSPDGRRLAAGSVENTVKVWDLATGQAAHTFWGHTEPVLHVTFSSDGRHLISAGRERAVKVWHLRDAERGVSTPPWTLSDFSTSVWAVAVSPDGSRLAVGGPKADGNVRVYDMATGKLLHTLMGDIRVISVAFSPDGRRLASAGSDRIVRLWDTMTGHEVLSMRGHDEQVGRVLFSPDGRRLASASSDGTVRVCDASPFDENADPHTWTSGGHDGEFFGLAFSPDSRRLALASGDRSIKLWDVPTRQEVRAFQGHTEPALCVAFSPDGRRLLSGSMDRTVKLWDIRTGKELRTVADFKLMVHSVAFRCDGEAFATGSQHTLQLWDAQTGQQLLARQADPEFVSCAAFSADGKYLATAGHTRTAKVWHASAREPLSYEGHQTSVFCVAFHPTGMYLASAGTDKDPTEDVHRGIGYAVKLWDRESCQTIRTLSGHTAYVHAVAFSPDGRYLATGGEREVIVWDVQSLQDVKKVQTFGRLAGRICGVAFSPDGKRLAAAGGYKGKGEFKIWDSSLWEKSAGSNP